jgi:hypothetical protein
MKTLLLNSRREFIKNSALLTGALLLGRPAWGTELPLRMIHPYPNKVVWGAGALKISQRTRLAVGGGTAPSDLAMLQETWRQFTAGAVKLDVVTDAAIGAHQFVLGTAKPPELEAKSTYALRVGAKGIAVAAVDAASLRHAWFTLLQLLQANDAAGALEFVVPQVAIQDWPALKFRGLHLCIFHETTPLMIEKALRLAAFLKFSHVVLEFWGMLRLDALKELSWPDAWSKSDARKLMETGRSMGLEIIPMFNCWGHATACRIKHGRHVVLDQDPKLAPLFEPDGWTWCLTNPRTQALLRSVCDELCEFAGPGQYFHIGCDEAYSHATCDRCRQGDRVKLFADHVNAMAAHLEQRGRRAIMWGDPLLERGKWPAGFSANGSPDLPTHLALDAISKKIVIADWHYDVFKGEVPTLKYFHEHGFETLACPWNALANVRTLAKAAAANQSGLLMTTWHHLVQSIPALPYVAACAWSQDQAALGLRQTEGSLSRAAMATILRKLVPAGGRFERAGWNPFEQPLETD